MTEHELLSKAIDLALENVAAGGRPFAALVVRDGEIIATGVNRALTDNDPTAHAELLAIRAAATKLGSLSLEDCVVIASGEPCPMCQAAAMTARVSRMVYAADVRHAAEIGLDTRPVRDDLARPQSERTITRMEHRWIDGARTPFEAFARAH